MKVKRILGTEKVYVFEDDEIVPFWDTTRYNEKLKEGVVEKAKYIPEEVQAVSEVIENKPRRSRRKRKE